MRWQDFLRGDIAQEILAAGAWHQDANPRAAITSVARWVGSAPAEGLSPQVLNFLEGDPDVVASSGSSLNCVVLSDVRPETASLSGNVLVVSDRQTYDALYLEVVRELDEQNVLSHHLEVLERMVLDNEGLQAMVDYLSDVYHVPVNVADSAFNLIACSTVNMPRNEEFRREVESGHLGSRPVKMMRKGGFAGTTRKKREASLVSVEVGGRALHNYLTMVYVQNTPIASFALIDVDKDLDRVQVGFLPRFADMISLELQKGSVGILSKSDCFSEVLAAIIGHKGRVDLSDVADRLAIFGYYIKPWLRILCLDTRETSYDERNLRILVEYLQRKIGNCIYLLRDTDVVFLLSQESPDFDFGALESEVYPSLEAAHVRLGVSGPYREIGESDSYLEQAQHAIATGAHYAARRLVLPFDEFALSDLALNLVSKGEGRLYRYQPVDMLMAYDKEHGGCLMETLLAYYEHSHSPNSASKALHIHRNTLAYRLDKVREIMGVDIDDGRVATRVYLTLAIRSAKGTSLA